MTAVLPVPVAVPQPPAPASEWILTAPWWHWPKQAPTPPARTAPAVQKYASATLVDDFLADPQRRLVFDPVADVSTPPPVGSFGPLIVSGTLLKLYLPTHHRSYLVAVELHCDRPGLPNPDRSGVCEAAFVIRRRSPDVPPPLAADARARQRTVARIRAQITAVDRRLIRAARGASIGQARFTALTDQRRTLTERLTEAETQLRDWALANGITASLQGWVPLAVDDAGHLTLLPERPGPGHRPLPGLGRWVPVDEEPSTIHESTFPLYPLVPDPRDPHHDGMGRTIYFGVVPTVLSDRQVLDPPAAGEHGTKEHPRVDRSPRLDELSTYEIRCVVRQHDPGCPIRPGQRDCHGPLVWSEPTAPFRLAGPLDPRGTANRPVTIRLPSRAELADAAALPAGFGGVRIAGADYPTDPGGGGEFQICSFGIPLITIVATFVLKLFLPIVVFLLGLWILLALKLCIPPSVSVSGEMEAALNADVKPPAFDADADLALEMDSMLGGAGDALRSGIERAGITPEALDNFPQEMKAGDQGAEDWQFRLMRALYSSTLRAPGDDLVYERRVERAEVLG